MSYDLKWGIQELTHNGSQMVLTSKAINFYVKMGVPLKDGKKSVPAS